MFLLDYNFLRKEFGEVKFWSKMAIGYSNIIFAHYI
jgi:hypothetical protein